MEKLFGRDILGLLSRLILRLKTGLALLGLSVVAVMGAEVLARFIVFADDSYFDPPSQVDFGFVEFDGDVRLSIEEGGASGLDLAYKPYTIWSRRPYSGSLVNVDDNGNRVTKNNSESDDALKIWMFGGSTTWGWGRPTTRPYLAIWRTF